MDLVVAGHPNKVVAHRLGIAVRTVEIHRARVMEKTGARNLSELVRLAILLESSANKPPPALVVIHYFPQPPASLPLI